MNKKLLICGGDLRQAAVANIFASYGCDVGTYGFEEYEQTQPLVKRFDKLKKALDFADVVILPLPCSTDNKTVNMALSDKILSFSELFEQICSSKIVIAGNVSEGINNLAKEYSINIIDYYNREELKIKNAIPTVEGALQIAMEETAITIHGSKCLVAGYGRIGKMLAHALKNMGAQVTVSARRLSDIAWASLYGFDTILTQQISEITQDMDIIFNTVPQVVLGQTELEKTSKNCLVIDLASKPGGVDFNAAAQLGIKVIWALSLPGKVAPITAGKIITDTIINLLKELEV